MVGYARTRLYLSGCRSCGLKMNIPNRSVPSWRKPGRLPGGEADDADAVAGSLEMADAVVETEVEMSGKPEAGAVDAVHETPPAEPVRPQVVEQTLF